MAMEEKFSGKVFTYFLQKLNTSWMIIDETLWSRDIKFSQSQLFWFCSSPFYPILSSHDCNPENWASNSTILFLVYKHRTKKFARIFKNITSEALCEAVASTLYKLEVLLIFKKYLWKNQILFSTKLNQQLFDNWQLSRAVWAVFLAPIKQIQKFRKTCDLVTNIQNQNVKTEQICYKMSFVFKNTYAKINAGYCGDHVGPTTTRQISCFVVTFRFCWSIQKVSNYSY